MNSLVKFAIAVGIVALPLGNAWAGASGNTSNIDQYGCENTVGYDATNNCGGTTFQIFHEDANFVGSSASGSSAYAALTCVQGGGYSLFRGAVGNGDVHTCTMGSGDFALQSICGASSHCESETTVGLQH